MIATVGYLYIVIMILSIKFAHTTCIYYIVVHIDYGCESYYSCIVSLTVGCTSLVETPMIIKDRWWLAIVGPALCTWEVPRGLKMTIGLGSCTTVSIYIQVKPKFLKYVPWIFLIRMMDTTWDLEWTIMDPQKIVITPSSAEFILELMQYI